MKHNADKMKQWWMLAAVTLVGCGNGLAGPDYVAPALATLNGQITNAQGLTTTQSVRAALVWRTVTAQANGSFLLAQDVAVSASFPSSFTLAISALPPSSALVPRGGSSVAQGVLLVYEDGNGNGTLDLPARTDQAWPDAILGAQESLTITYVEGPALAADPSTLTPALPQGFSQSKARSDGEAALGAATAQCYAQYPIADRTNPNDPNIAALSACVAGVFSTFTTTTTEDIATPIDIALAATPALPAVVCADLIPPGSIPPLSSTRMCASDGSWETRYAVTAPAGSPLAMCATNLLPANVTLPYTPERENWPCPRQP
jgi:hypothetical protein